MRALAGFAFAVILLARADREDRVVRISRPAAPLEETAVDPPTPAARASPPDPERDAAEAGRPEQGTARLFLRLLDEASGEPTESEVQLWRLGVPADSEWTEGDLLQETLDVGTAGVLVEDLPCGRYRVFALEQRDGSEDPGEFEVGETGATAVLRIPMPGLLTVRLALLDEHGRPISEMRCAEGGCSDRSGGAWPEWARERRRRGPESRPEGRDLTFETSGSCSCGGRGPVLRAAADGTVEIGRLRTDSRRESRARSWSVSVEGRTSVSVEVTGAREPGETLLFGTSVPLECVRRFVLLPDGRRASEAGARVFGSCEAGPEPARRIRVVATLVRHEPLCAILSLDDPEPLVLEPDPEGRPE